MRITNVFSGRPAYYDRNPLMISNNYNQTIAPAALTVRWTYTVPTARKAYVEQQNSALDRATAAGTAAQMFAGTRYTPNGGSVAVFTYAVANTNTLNQEFSQLMGGSMVMLAGDKNDAVTSDLSTTGTVEFLLNGKCTEFDA